MENTSVHLEEPNSESAQTPHHTEGLLLENLSEPLISVPRKHKFIQLDSNDLTTIQVHHHGLGNDRSKLTAGFHTLQVDQVLFRVSVDILQLCSAIKEPIANTFAISGITAPRLRSFLTVVATKTVRPPSSISLEDLISALHAAMQLGCDKIRKHAINSISKHVASLGAVPLIQLGLRYRVYDWAREGFTRLIERNEPISSEEGTSLGMELVLAIYRNRETLTRSQKGDNCTTSELIKKDPVLSNPPFEKLDEMEFHASVDTSSASKDKLHYQTGLVNLLVNDTTWTVSLETIGNTSYFVDRLGESGLGGWPNVDISGEVDKAELESYLSLVNSRSFCHSSGDTLGLSFHEWVGALRLATIFGYNDARRFAISFLGRQVINHDPFDVIDAAKTCNVDQWLKPEYVRIAKRKDIPSEQEGRRLGVASLLAVCRLREQTAYNSGKAAGVVQVVKSPCEACSAAKKDKKKK